MSASRGWTRRARPLAVAGLALPLLLALLAASRPPLPPPAAVPQPRLLVMVSVDGLNFSRLEAYRPWYVAGLRRLLDEGLVETECRYRHLNTETGPGHAALGAGAPPRVTGIPANVWYAPDPSGRLASVYCVATRGPDPLGRGPQDLRVSTLGDRLAARWPSARVVSLSGKDRAAILMAGHVRTGAVYWYDRRTGQFVSSAAYDPPPAAAALVAEANLRGAGPARFGPVWSALPPPEDARDLPRPVPDLLDYQIPVLGLGFDHPLEYGGTRYWDGVYLSPFVDELVTDLAIDFLRDAALGLGRGPAPDLLALGFSAHDTVAHNYGDGSEETLEVLRRLDLDLGRILDALDHLGPKGSVALALSSDHGFTPIPEAARARGEIKGGGRLVESERTHPTFLERLNRLLDESLCVEPKAPLLHGGDGWGLYYDRSLLPLERRGGDCGEAGARVDAAAIDAVLPSLLRRFWAEEVREVFLTSQREHWPEDDPFTEFVRNDFDPERSGDALMIPQPDVLMHWDPGRGSSHGSPYESDIHVPLVFWGAAFAAGRDGRATTPYDLAPTLGALVGVRLPDATGTPLAAERPGERPRVKPQRAASSSAGP